MAGKEIALIDEENMTGEDADNRAQVRVWLRLLACTSLIGAELRRQFREEFDFTMPRFDVLAQLDREPVGAFEHAQRLLQRRAPLRRLEIARELEHGGVVERRLAMEVAAGGEDKERAPDGCVAFVLGDRQGLAREVREHDELYVIRRRSDTRLRSSRA